MYINRVAVASTPEEQYPKRKQWHQHAACYGSDPTTYDDDEQASYPPPDVKCFTCPVQDICLAVALKEQLTGIWGGTTTKQRRSLIRRRSRQSCPMCSAQFIIPIYDQKYEICLYCGVSWPR